MAATPFLEYRERAPSFVRPIGAPPATGGTWIYSADAARSRLYGTASSGGASPGALSRLYSSGSESASPPARTPRSYAPPLRTPPPAQPLSIPSPARSARGRAEQDSSSSSEDERTSDDEDEREDTAEERDYVTQLGFAPEEWLVADGEVNGYTASSKRPFVGGLVSGLKKLPRAVARSARGAPPPGSRLFEPAAPHASPGPTPPHSPSRASEMGESARYMQSMEIPVTYLAPVRSHTPLEPPPLPRSSSGASTSLGARSRRSASVATTRNSQRSQRHRPRLSEPGLLRNPDLASVPASSAPSTSGPTSPRTTRPADSRAASDAGNGQLSSPTQSSSAPPTYHEPPHAPNYEPPRAPNHTQMQDTGAKREETLRVRAARFLSALNALPWLGEPVAADFVPAETGRGRRRSEIATPWYSDRTRANASGQAGYLGQQIMQQQYAATYLPPLVPPQPMHTYAAPQVQAALPAYPLYMSAAPSSSVSSPELFASFTPPPAAAYYPSNRG